MPTPTRPDSILFVCLGNICRSPLAEGIARDINQKQQLGLTIDSCGTGGWHIGSPPCENSIKIAKQKGIDISDLRARQVSRQDFERFDAIICMDASNYDTLLSQRCNHDKLHKLGDFGHGGADVPDPYYFEDFAGFVTVYEMVENGVQQMLCEMGFPPA